MGEDQTILAAAIVVRARPQLREEEDASADKPALFAYRFSLFSAHVPKENKINIFIFK